MVIVGVDGGLVNTGIVVVDLNHNLLASHTIKVVSTSAQRLYDIEVELHRLLEPYAHEDITLFMEGYAYAKPYQRESLAELGGVLRRYFHVHNYPYWIIPPNTIKLFVAGTGTANKGFMAKKTKEKWSHVFKNDHECDAYGLARLGTNVINCLGNNRHVPEDLDILEAEVIIDIVDNAEHFLLANTASRRQTKKQRYANKRNKDPKS